MKKTVIITIVLAIVIFFSGYQLGKMNTLNKSIKETIAALNKRKTIDDAVKDIDLFRLCTGLGGVPSECEPLRGVDKAAKN